MNQIFALFLSRQTKKVDDDNKIMKTSGDGNLAL
jgi:hypothetical protein